ncbi:MAG: sigma-54 dependent transcriptional regulator [Bacteroidetes bacterium]|nr:sigma-54 dependent transcriptional regulator [Bacteroidota bacterium]
MFEWRNTHLLIVEDETDSLNLLVERFERKGCQVTGTTSSEEALRMLKEASVDVGIYDINLPNMNGVELLRATKELDPDMEVIMLTGHGSVETAIETMKLGAYDYLRKPYALAELEIVVSKAWEKKKLREANSGLKQALLSGSNNFTIVGQSPAMKKILDLTRRLARSDIPVRIDGESGTGKELIAKALHFWSTRANQPFVAINAGAIPENLLESELFGHVKGAFTGATQEKKGLVEAADQGTLFLDEIGEMPLNFQVKLLRFLEGQEYRRVGESRLRQVNVRIVAATNRALEEEMAKGNFREDLFYRLNVMKLTLPPLRDRPDDIPLLTQHFLAMFSKGRKVTIAPEALQALRNYHLPGNVRELSHMIERGILLSTNNRIETKDLLIPETFVSTQPTQNDIFSLTELEKRHIQRILAKCQGNKTKAAKILGISVRNLYRKLEEYDL